MPRERFEVTGVDRSGYLYVSPDTPWPEDSQEIVDRVPDGQYVQVISSPARWQDFEPVLKTSRKAATVDLKRVNELRYAVSHFRRQILPRDTDALRRFRDRLRMRLNA